jgi:hypothetical protein
MNKRLTKIFVFGVGLCALLTSSFAQAMLSPHTMQIILDRTIDGQRTTAFLRLSATFNSAQYDVTTNEGRLERLSDMRYYLCKFLADETRFKNAWGLSNNVVVVDESNAMACAELALADIQKLYKEHGITIPALFRNDYQELLHDEEEICGTKEDDTCFAPIAPAHSTKFSENVVHRPVSQKVAERESRPITPGFFAKPIQLLVPDGYRIKNGKIIGKIVRDRRARKGEQIRPAYVPLTIIRSADQDTTNISRYLS